MINKSGRTRYFNDEVNGRDVQNAPPGMVVDCSRPGAQVAEFMMIANNETLSTAKPVRYIVIRNEDLGEEAVAMDAAPAAPPAAPQVNQDLVAIEEILRTKSEFVGGELQANRIPPPERLISFLTELVTSLGPHVPGLGAQLRQDMQDGFSNACGWDTVGNRPLDRPEPPNVNSILA